MTESLVDKDYSAKLVLCLRNPFTYKEQIFALNLENLENESIFTFHGQVQDLFSNQQVNIGVLRKIDVNFYQDILSSYNSSLTTTLKQKSKKKKQEESQKKKSEENHSVHSGTSFKVDLNTHFDSKKNPLLTNNYTVFSFVNLKREPYLKIKKKNGYIMKDNRDIHLRLTNVQEMESFFVKIHIRYKCDQLKWMTPRLDYLANAQLEGLNSRFQKSTLGIIDSKIEEEETGEGRKKPKRRVTSIQVNWAVEKVNRYDSFYKSRADHN